MLHIASEIMVDYEKYVFYGGPRGLASAILNPDNNFIEESRAMNIKLDSKIYSNIFFF